MSIRFVAAGYGAAALAALRATVAELKADDPLLAVTIIVPNNLAGIVARRRLAAGIGAHSGVAGLEFTTLAKLAERLAAADLAPRRPATAAIVAAAWRRMLRDEPRGFAPIAGHPATIRALADAHRALRDLDDAALDSVAASTRVAGDLVALHRQVVSTLSTDWYDRTDLLRAAASLAHPLGPCVVYLPQDLDSAERQLLSALPDVTVIAARTGVARADRGVAESVAALGGDQARDRLQIANGTRVVTASDSDDEVRAIVRDLLQTLRITPASRIAVLYSSAVPYARLLGEQLAAAGVQVNGAGVRAAEERAIPRLLTGLLGLVDNDVARSEMFDAIAAAPVRDFAAARIPLATWERASRAAGVVSGDDWQQRLAEFADRRRREATAERSDREPRDWLADRFDREADVADALGGFAVELRTRLQRASRLTSWRELTELSRRLLDDLVPPDRLANLPAEEQYAAAIVRTTLDNLGALDEIDPHTTLAAMRDALDVELAAALPRVGRFGDGVLVAPMSAAVGLDLDVVYLVGMSEDLYPGRLRPDGLLPDRARAAARGRLPAQRDRLDRMHRHLLAAIAAAPVSVVSFPRGDLRRSTARLPSRFVLPTLRALAGDHELPATGWQRADYSGAVTNLPSFAGTLGTTPIPATEQEWRVRCGAADDEVVAAAAAMIRARRSDRFTRYDGNLAGVAGLPDFGTGKRAVSPTALEQYAECPHAFFVDRLLGVEPLEAPESIVFIAPTDIGNLVHQSVEQFITEFSDRLPRDGAPWTDAQRARLVEIAAERAEQFRQRGLTGHPRLWEAERAGILADVDELLRDEDRWRAEHRISVVASEMAFGQRGEPPVLVPIDCGAVALRGSADRVDRGVDGTLFVTDLKTGGADRFSKISVDDPTIAGTKLQLPVYAHAVRNRYGDAETRVEAQYWFVRRDRGKRIPLALTAEVEQTYARTLAVLVRSIAAGRFPPKAPEVPDFAWVQCPYCNPDSVGHVENRERWERKRTDPALRELTGLIDPDAAVDW